MLKKIIVSILITSAICLSGCGNNSKTDTATLDSVSTIVTQSSNNTDSEDNQIEQTILDSGLKIDKEGKITDSEGKEIKSEDGKIKITTEDGKTVEVETSQIEAVNNSSSSKTDNKSTSAVTSTNKNNSSNKGAASNKVDTNKNNTSLSKNESSKVDTSNKNNSSSNKNNSTGSSTTNKNNSSSSKPTSSSSASSTNKQESSNKTWHEAEYEYINHPAETKKVWVVDKEAYTYEEPVYEEQGRAICKRCNADITDNIDHIFDCNSSYKITSVKIQVGTKTVEVPEEGHWETVVVKEAWTEKILVKESGWY